MAHTYLFISKQEETWSLTPLRLRKLRAVWTFCIQWHLIRPRCLDWTQTHVITTSADHSLQSSTNSVLTDIWVTIFLSIWPSTTSQSPQPALTHHHSTGSYQPTVSSHRLTSIVEPFFLVYFWPCRQCGYQLIDISINKSHIWQVYIEP